MGACPSDLAGPTTGPPASTDDIKAKQSKVNESGDALRKANKKLDDTKTKLSGLQTRISTTQDELSGANLRIAKRGESVASAKTPQAKDDALRKVEIEKAKKVRLEAEEAQLKTLIDKLNKDIAELEKTSKTAKDSLATAKTELATTIQRVTDESAAKKAADEAAAAEAERLRKEAADEAAEKAEMLRQEEELKAAAEAERLQQEQEDRAAIEADRLRQEEGARAAAEAVVPTKLSELVDVLNSFNFSKEEIKQAARRLGEFKESAIDNIDYVEDIDIRPRNINSIVSELKDTGLFSRDEISKISNGLGASPASITTALDIYMPPTPGQQRRADMEVPRPFEPPELPEGLTPEQQRRVAMGGPIPAAAVTPLPPPEQPLSQPSLGKLKLAQMTAQSLNLTPLITKLFEYGFSEEQIKYTLEILNITPDKIERDITEVSATVTKNSVPRNVDDIIKTLKDMKFSQQQIRRALFVGLAIPFREAQEAINRVKGGRRRTQRRRNGGNQPVKYTPLTPENIKKDVESSVAKSPGVAETVKKLQEKKGGRRRTFRKKKTLKQIETQLKDIQKSLASIK